MQRKVLDFEMYIDVETGNDRIQNNQIVQKQCVAAYFWKARKIGEKYLYIQTTLGNRERKRLCHVKKTAASYTLLQLTKNRMMYIG